MDCASGVAAAEPAAAEVGREKERLYRGGGPGVAKALAASGCPAAEDGRDEERLYRGGPPTAAAPTAEEEEEEVGRVAGAVDAR